MHMHYLPGCEGSVYLHGSVSKERPDRVEYNPTCYALACRRSIAISLEVLTVSEFWMGLNYKDLRQRRSLLPILQEVMRFIRKPTCELETQARHLARHCVKNRKA